MTSITYIKERFDWIDSLRGIAMIIVMLWHISNGISSQWLFSVFTSPIMIPLFFSITGYVFNDCKGNSTLFFKKLFFKLVIPWLGLSLGKALVIALIRHSVEYFVEYSVGVITGINLWYMPCCIVGEIIHYFVLKFSKNTYQITITSIALMITGYFLAQYNILDIMCINIALVAQGYILIGYLIKSSTTIKTIIEKYIFAEVCLYFALGLISVFAYKEMCMDVHKNSYYSWLICIPMIILGCVSCFSIAPKIEKHPKLLTFIGRNTLVFYIFHYDTIYPFEQLSNKIGIALSGWSGVIVKFVWSLLICTIIAIVLNRYMPQLVGKKRIKSSPSN